MQAFRAQHWATLEMVGEIQRFYLHLSSLIDLMLGNYHTVIVCPEGDRDKGEEILGWVQRRAVELEGTITGEHGIGLKLRDGLINEVGPEAVDMMRKVRETRTSRGSAALIVESRRSSWLWTPFRYSILIKWCNLRMGIS